MVHHPNKTEMFYLLLYPSVARPEESLRMCGVYPVRILAFWGWSRHLLTN